MPWRRNVLEEPMAVAYVVVVPHRRPRPCGASFARRRVLAVAVLILILCAVSLVAHTVLAGREGAPASTLAARPSTAALAAAAAQPALTGRGYLVLPGDSLWSIAERFRGGRSLTGYLERLIEVNGGTHLAVGQTLSLP
jgi:LysM domain